MWVHGNIVVCVCVCVYSGHYTMDGCQTSQFENHVRAVLGWPLGATTQIVPYSIMLNLVGEADGDEGVKIGTFESQIQI